MVADTGIVGYAPGTPIAKNFINRYILKNSEKIVK
jgi:hypothetical protein